MKSRLHKYLFLLGFLSMVAATGCRDKCKRVDCIEGTCVDGTCECNEGYFGALCNQTLNENYNGAFALTENCTAGADLYDVSIQPSPDNNLDILITGLWEQVNAVVRAQVGADGYSFVIQRKLIAINREITGDATVNEAFDEISLNYQIYETGASQPFEQCTAALVKK